MNLMSFNNQDNSSEDKKDRDSGSVEYVAAPTTPEADGMVERELKMRLGGMEDWQAVKSYFDQPDQRLEQHNFYLDTASGRLAAGHALLRVRVEKSLDKERYLLVYKRGVDYQAGYFQAIEVEAEISRDIFVNLQRGDWDQVENLAPIKCLRIEGIDEPLFIIGEAENLRLRFLLKNGDYLELDRTSFSNGRTDYEIEVETMRPSQVMTMLTQLKNVLGLNMVEQTSTKYERFLETLK